MIEFLIVGGGIGGAVLARLLARQGRQIMVLERESSPRHVVRPEVLWPASIRTLEPMLASLNASDWHIPLKGLRIFAAGRPLIEVGETAIRESGVEPHSTDPNVTRAGLLADPAFEIRRGVEMTELVRQGDRVTGARVRAIATRATSEIATRWVIGDDGGHSLVREQCGIPLQCRQLSLELACTEIVWPREITAMPHVMLDVHSSSSGILAMGAIPLPQSRGIGLVAVRRCKSLQLDKIQDLMKGVDIAGTPFQCLLNERNFPADFAVFRPQFGHAPRYGVPGAVLLGDAAHPVTPAGGQGANMAIADAVALADCIREGHDEDLIARYERRRRRANERSVSISRSVTRVLRLPAWLMDRLVLPVGKWLGRRPAGPARVLRTFSTAFLDSTD
jgi:2-polyprenyl-6-methoxyphenol hydroxylase-like FAD-dependent oxidoreductase